MPEIPRYQRNQSIPAIGVAAPVSIDNAGLIGNTISAEAEQFGDVIAKHQESLRRRDNANKLLNLQTAYDDAQRAFEQEEMQKTGPDSYDNIERAKQFRDQQVESLTRDITDPELALAVKRHIVSSSQSALNSLAGHQARQRNEVTKQALQSASESRLKDAYAGMPIDDVRQRLFETGVILVDSGVMDNTRAETYIMEEERKIAEAYLDGLVNRDFPEAARIIKSGELNKYLDQKTIERYDKQLKPKLQANKVDEIVGQISYMLPGNEDEPFEIDKMMKKVDTLTDDPEVRKDVRTQLKSVAADRQAASKERFEYNYGIIADAWERNPKLSTADVMKMPEFGKLTTAQQGNVLAKIRTKIEHRDSQERTIRAAERSAGAAERAAAAAEKAAVQEKYDKAYYYWRSRPEDVAAMTDSQFSTLRLDMGDKQFAHLQDDRKKFNSPEALQNAANHATAITSVLDTIPGLNDSDKARYMTRLKRAIGSEQKRLNRQLSGAEIESTVIENMQLHLVKEKGWFGTQKEKRKIEVLKTDQPLIPEAYQKRIDAVATKRGKVFSVAEQQKLYRAILANEGSK